MFDEEEEEEEPIEDMTELMIENIEAYDEAFRVLYDYCLMHNLLNRTFLGSTMNRYRVSVENLMRCTECEMPCTI